MQGCIVIFIRCEEIKVIRNDEAKKYMDRVHAMDDGYPEDGKADKIFTWSVLIKNT